MDDGFSSRTLEFTAAPLRGCGTFRYGITMDLLLGTNNPGKIIEMGEALHGLPLTLLTPEHVNIQENPEETGTTFRENAHQKATFYFERAEMPTLADDSGIIIEALKGELGIHTRRWGAGPDASDEEWIAHFLDRMKGEENKKASFICSLAFIDASGKPHVFEGQCDGVITEALEAEYLPGLPISACFKPLGYDKVFSALSLEQKNSTSHRGRALGEFGRFLQ